MALLSSVLAVPGVALTASPAAAVDNFPNGSIADQALARLGHVGSQTSGQCKQFANDMARLASGGSVTLGGGYYSDYHREGGILVTSAQAVKGDIIQLNKAANRDGFYDGMHTAIIVANLGNGAFDVVDSNWGWDLTVKRHNWNPHNYATGYGLEVNIWRLGQVSIPPGENDPIGNFESMTQVLGGVRLTGWTADPNSPAESLQVHVYEDECCAHPRGAYMANVPRADVGAALPGYGNLHGFNIHLALPNGLSGLKRYCAYGINVGSGRSRFLGCKTVTFNWNPAGNYEHIRRVPGGAHLSGWTLDPETADPIQVHAYEGACCAHPRGAGIADQPRPDVGLNWPGHGDNHGFGVIVNAYPTTPVTKTYCTYGINAGYGVSTDLGCRSLTIDPNPTGHFSGIEAVTGGARVTGWTLDPDTAESIQVHFWAGSIGAARMANITRPDVAAVWTGYGANHGFDTNIPLPSGTHNVCAYGINNTAGHTNTALGCRTVMVA